MKCFHNVTCSLHWIGQILDTIKDVVFLRMLPILLTGSMCTFGYYCPILPCLESFSPSTVRMLPQLDVTRGSMSHC